MEENRTDNNENINNFEKQQDFNKLNLASYKMKQKYFYGKSSVKKVKKKKLTIFIVFSYIICSLVSIVIGGCLTFLLLKRIDVDKYNNSISEDNGVAQENVELLPKNLYQNIPGELPDLGGDLPIIEDSLNPVPDIVEQLQPAIVSILVQQVSKDQSDTPVVKNVSAGSGFIITKDGYIVTNNHVIEQGNQFIVIDSQELEYNAEFVGTNTIMDIAVLKIEAKHELKALPIGNSNSIRSGEMVIAVGNPFGANTNLAGTVTVGYVSAEQRNLVVNGIEQRYIQTDAALNMGNSGGPLLNTRGEIIGVNNLKSLVSVPSSNNTVISSEGIGFAIPINDAIECIKQIILSGSTTKPGIGIYFYDLTYEECVEFSISSGCRIDSFMTNSIAESSGLKVGDIIVECDGEKQVNINYISNLISQKNIGDTVNFVILRDNSYLEFNIEIVIVNILR